MTSPRELIGAVVLALGFAAAAAFGGDALKPAKPTWKRIEVQGLIDVHSNAWSPKRFDLVTTVAGYECTRRQLVFADNACFRLAEIHTNWPVKATVIEIMRGSETWFLVETLEPLK